MNERLYASGLLNEYNKADYNLDYKTLTGIGKSLGFEWGGDWKGFKDKPHSQMLFGKSLKVIKGLPKDSNGLPILKQ